MMYMIVYSSFNLVIINGFHDVIDSGNWTYMVYLYMLECHIVL